jgi:hypothetical protein
MQTTTAGRSPERVRRTHEAIEQVLRRTTGPLDAWAVLVGEKRNTSEAHAMTRGDLAQHLQRKGVTGAPLLQLFEIAELVRSAPAGRAPVVIATIEGTTILQWVEARP